MRLKYFSLFTGIGGLDMGLNSFADCAGFSEIKKTSIEIYKNHYPDHVNFGDLTKIDFNKLPDFDILTGGFPCQSFSLAGLRKGLKDKKGEKGQMIFYIYDLIITKNPKYIILENVKGLLNHDGGKTYAKVVKLLRSAGYFVNVLLLNAIDYGSAQNRERVIFLCSKKEFERKIPIKIDNTKLFRDIREDDGNYKLIKDSEKNRKKIEQKLDFNFELIGGYDKVGTLTTQYGCGEKAVPCGAWFRYLTVLECERLQGFPEGWTDGVIASAKYFALGNAVNCKMSDYLINNYLKGLWW